MMLERRSAENTLEKKSRQGLTRPCQVHFCLQRAIPKGQLSHACLASLFVSLQEAWPESFDSDTLVSTINGWRHTRELTWCIDIVDNEGDGCGDAMKGFAVPSLALLKNLVITCAGRVRLGLMEPLIELIMHST